MTTLTRAAMAHNHAETSLTSRTAPTGAIRQITRASPMEKFASTSAKNARSRQQRVSVSNPSISNTHTALVTMDQASCAQSKSPWRTWPQDKYAKYEQLSTPASPQIGCPHIRCAGLIRRGLVVICVSTAAHVFREKR